MTKNQGAIYGYQWMVTRRAPIWKMVICKIGISYCHQVVIHKKIPDIFGDFFVVYKLYF